MPTPQEQGVYVHGAKVTQSPVHGGLVPTHGGRVPTHGLDGGGAVTTSPLVIAAQGVDGTSTAVGDGSYNIVSLNPDRINAYSAEAAGDCIATIKYTELGVGLWWAGLSYVSDSGSVVDNATIDFGIQCYADGEAYLWTGATGNNGFTNRILPNIALNEIFEIRKVGSAITLWRGGVQILAGVPLAAVGTVGFRAYAQFAGEDINVKFVG